MWRVEAILILPLILVKTRAAASLVSAERCPLTKASLLKRQCNEHQTQAIVCNTDHNTPGELTHGFPMLVFGSVHVAARNTSQRNKRYDEDPAYSAQIDIATRGCAQSIAFSLRHRSRDIAVRFQSDRDRARLDRVLPRGRADMTPKNHSYQCRHERFMTETIRDPLSRIRYIYQVDIRSCLCNTERCNAGRFRDAVEAHFAPLACLQFDDYETKRRTKIDALVCAISENRCAAVRIRRPNGVRILGGCYDEQWRSRARQLGLGDDVGGSRNSTTGGAHVDFVLCSKSFCNSLDRSRHADDKTKAEGITVAFVVGVGIIVLFAVVFLSYVMLRRRHVGSFTPHNSQ